MMDVSIVIVSWNVRDSLRACLESVRRAEGGLRLETIVVDNSSEDGSADMVRVEFPEVRLIALKTNQGFARACNRGMREAQGDYTLVLNPDAQLMPDTLDTLHSFMRSNPGVDMVSPKIVAYDGSFQRSSMRRDPTLCSQLLILLKIDHWMPNLKVFRSYYWTSFNPEQEQEIEQIMGAALFARTHALRNLGYFDEQFFLWFEDVDLCYRARKTGRHLRYCPFAVVRHRGGLSFSQRSLGQKQRFFAHSMMRFFYKHRGVGAAFAVACVSAPVIAAAYVYERFTGRARG